MKSNQINIGPYEIRGKYGLSRSDEPSAASWSLALYTNATLQTGRRPFAWVIQLLAVSLKDENLLLEDQNVSSDDADAPRSVRPALQPCSPRIIER